MQQSKPAKRKRGIRLGPSIVKEIEDWRRAQREIPSRSEAVNALLQRALKAEQRDAASPP
jgi:Arc/MetJ-type ribon-helix-helix transcriptional regulator